MESLALLAALIIISFWTVAGLSLLFSFFRLRILGLIFGCLSLAAGVWLIFILPHAPLLGIINIVCGLMGLRTKNKEQK